jgi:hypothetical protein
MSHREIVIGLDDSRSARSALQWGPTMRAARVWRCARSMY